MNELTLIKNECANYFPTLNNIKHYCCFRDKPCVYFAEELKPVCKYFETAVLPLNPELEVKYKRERGISVISLQAVCKKCSSAFVRKSKKKKFCDDCTETRKKEQARLRMRNKRRKIMV